MCMEIIIIFFFFRGVIVERNGFILCKVTAFTPFPGYLCNIPWRTNDNKLISE